MAERVRSSPSAKPPGTGRIETFSDGVMAIVLTIMVLELKPTDVLSARTLAEMLRVFEPKAAVYALSFVTIAVIAINHHTLLRAAPHSTTALYWWNANLLFWMSLIPLSTAVLGNAPFQPLAAAFYGLIMVANSVSFTLLHRCVAKIGRGKSVVERHHLLVIYKDIFFTGLYVASVPLAFVSVYASMVIFVVVLAAYFFPDFVPWPRSWR